MLQMNNGPHQQLLKLAPSLREMYCAGLTASSMPTCATGIAALNLARTPTIKTVVPFSASLWKLRHHRDLFGSLRFDLGGVPYSLLFTRRPLF
jgi:hypothetical protein